MPTISVPPLPAVAACAGRRPACAALPLWGRALRFDDLCGALSGRSKAPAAPPGGASRWAAPAAALLALPWLTSCLLGRPAPWDWAFVGQRLLVICESAFALTLAMRLARSVGKCHRISPQLALVPPLAALAFLVAVPHAALRMAGWTGDRRIEPASAFEQHAAAIPLFQVAEPICWSAPTGIRPGGTTVFSRPARPGTGDPLSIPGR